MKLSIPSTCHENWQEMQPVQGGRHCSHCQKTVIDFTAMSDKEILLLLQDNKALCGRFNSLQLNRELDPPLKKRWPWALLAGLTVLGIETAAAKSSPKITCSPASERNNPPTVDSGRMVSGYVVCNNEKFKGVTVLIKGTQIGTITNDSGYFKLNVPATIKSELIEIVVNFIGFETQTIMASPSTQNSVCIKLEKNSNSALMGELIVRHTPSTVIKKPTFWQRLKSAFK